MIRPEDVADLQPGDVVEITETDGGDEIRHIGPLRREGTELALGSLSVVHPSGALAGWWDTLTVVSRAPRPFYTNSDRTEPVPGDVARDENADGIRLIFRTRGERFPDKWIDSDGIERCYDGSSPSRLRLLVDGETGQVVQ